MTRWMLDGIASDAPAMARAVASRAGSQEPIRLVAGYDDGLYAWSSAEWALFPGLIHVHIAVFADTDSGTVLDCEPGNCTPAQSVDWVLMRRRAGVDPTVYCNQLNPVTGWPAVRAAFQARRVAEPHYWVANYDDSTAIPSGAVAKQYEDAGPYDLSSVADYWPGVEPIPTHTLLEDPMQDALYAVAPAPGGTAAGIWWYADGRYTHVGSIPQRDLIAAQFGVPEKPLPYAAHQLLLALTAAATGGAAPVDLAALEALIEQHLAAGSVPGVIAAAVLDHLSAATANATP